MLPANISQSLGSATTHQLACHNRRWNFRFTPKDRFTSPTNTLERFTSIRRMTGPDCGGNLLGGSWVSVRGFHGAGTIVITALLLFAPRKRMRTLASCGAAPPVANWSGNATTT